MDIAFCFVTTYIDGIFFAILMIFICAQPLVTEQGGEMKRLGSHQGPLLKLGGRAVLLVLLVSPCLGGTILQQMRLANFEEAVVVAERVDVCTSALAVSPPQPLPAVSAAPHCAAQARVESTKRSEFRDGQRADSLNSAAVRTEIPKCE